MPALSDTFEEAAINGIIGVDRVITMHTADPLLTGDNPATLDPADILAADGWSAMGDLSGGRGVTNALELNMGVATVVETLTHWMLWASDGTTPVGSWALNVEQTTTPGNPVIFPPGSLALVGRVAAIS